MKSKKASGGPDLFTNWVEAFFVVLLLIGFLIAAAIQSPILSYIVAFLSGLFFGKLIYHKKNDALLHYTLLTLGFMLGYAFGNAGNSWVLSILFFILGVFGSYILHDKGVI